MTSGLSWLKRAARSADAVSSVSAKRMLGLKRQNVAKVKIADAWWQSRRD
ncbi:hypothetical protein BIWAKO_03584 [Bosea sp. BIWAKO-01]|nr:hypothetical protein BIWAKO_03584 [Bosea sp. BIWAKO-01]